MKLYTKPASFRAQKVLITSLYANQKIEIVTDASDKAIKDLSPIAKLPLLSTPEGSIAESNAIARYVSNLGAKSLLGKSAVESAQVDSWMDFSANDVEVPATVVCYPIIGWMPLHSEAFDKAKKDLNLTLQTLESHLKTRTYLVGEAITLADIALSTALLLPFKMVFDEKLRKTFPCTTRWFITCVNQVNFKRVIGVTELCKEPLVPKGYKASEAATAAAVPKQKDAKKEAPKKEEAKKEAPKKEKPKPVEEAADEEEEDLVPKEKKPKHYCEELPPSPFVLDTWKRTYSNAPGGDCYKAMPWFWENFDATGFSLWIGEYNFNDELKVPFMISNLAGGFVQRCDEIRKYAFGVLQVLEKDGKYFIKGCFLFRGDTDKLMLEGNEDATSYTWTKLDHTSEANKKVVEDLWCAWEEIEGKKIIDCKVFK